MENKFTSALSFMKNASKSVYLYKNIWKENSTVLLHAPHSVDKSAKAIDIAVGLSAAGKKVLYVDTQSSLYDHVEQLKNASDNLSIFIPSYASPDDPSDYADLVFSGIEEAIAETDIRVFVIDSVTRIAALSFGKNASAPYIMKRLVALQVRHGVSFLVISHDTTRSTDRALINLADAVICAEPAMPELPTESRVKHIAEEVCNKSEMERQTVDDSSLTRQQRRALDRRSKKNNRHRR